MTDEEINARLAEEFPDKFRYDCVWFFQYAPDCWSQCHNSSLCDDLNAMHEAEKILTDHQHAQFVGHLYDLECELQLKTKIWRWFSSTARQRAEAILRTLGRWKE